MLLFTKRSNAEAAVINLLKYLKADIDPEKIIEELEMHPNYPSMLAVSDVLTALNIENSAFRANLEILAELHCPFIVNLNSNGGEFAVVNRMDAKMVYFSDERREVNKLSLADFKLKFAGVVLTAKRGTKFSLNTGISATAYRYKPILLVTGFLLILYLLLLNTGYFFNVGWIEVMLSFLKTAGLTVSVLLLAQSIDINNPLIKVLCQIGSKTDCNAILSSKAAKVFEGLSWSEVGFFYFAGTWLLLLTSGGSLAVLTILALLNLLSLPYTMYSIYYQAKVAKKWCILCCAIQTLLWLEFIPLISKVSSTHIYFGAGSSEALRLSFICLLLPILLWLVLRPLLFNLKQLQPLKDQLRKFKYNSDLFNQMLAAQPQFDQPDETWSIVLGNNAPINIITMVINPYCSPCAKMHKLLDELIEQNGELQARIIFTAQNTDTDHQTPVSRHLMALNALPDKTLVIHALDDWFEKKQKNYDSWAKVHPVQLIETDYYKLEEQKAFCRRAEVTVTPTVLINGHLLPSIYQLPDLKYMLNRKRRYFGQK